MRRAAVAAALGCGALGFGLALGRSAAVASEPILGYLALAVVLAVCFQVNVDLPNGSHVSVGNAVAVALATLLSARSAGLVAGLAITIAAAVWLTREAARVVVVQAGWIAAAAAAGIGTHAAVLPFVDDVGLHGDAAMLVRVVAAGIGFLAVELLVRIWLVDRVTRRRPRETGPLRATLRVHLALLCAAALVVVAASQRGPAAALVAAFPLLVIRFSFARYAAARRTYDQAVRALSIVPEVAGLADLGHGERTALYAGAIAESFQLEPQETERVVTAARLHHIGTIAFDDETLAFLKDDPHEVGRASFEILSETGFLDGVADLVRSVRAANPADVDLPCAIVRVASSFDELTAEDPTRAGAAAVELLARHTARVERSVAVALVQLCDRRPEFVDEVWAQGQFLSADAADHETHAEVEEASCV